MPRISPIDGAVNRTGVSRQMILFRLGRFVSAVPRSEVRAKANSVHCVRMLQGVQNYRFLSFMRRERALFTWGQTVVQLLVAKADAMRFCRMPGSGKGSWTTFYRIITSGGVGVLADRTLHLSRDA
jgi:hypothetical protein